MSAGFDEVYAFLRSNYLHSRFEGSDMCKDFPDYPKIITRSTIAQIEQTGKGFVSLYESRTARTIIFDADLNVLNPDAPPDEIQARPRNLTHIYGQSF